MIRVIRPLSALGVVVGLGFGLQWVTAGATAQASFEDLISMAFLAVGAVAWVAYAWLLVAVLATALEQTPGVLGRAASVVAGAITSQSSRPLLRSALGVAAVTPLTIGVAHAAPSDAPPRQPWTATERASTVSLTPSPPNWRLTETPSILRLTEPAPPATAPTRRAAAHRADVPAESAPESDRLHGSTGRPGVSPNDWRATERPSSVRLTGSDAASNKLPGARPTAEHGARPGRSEVHGRAKRPQQQAHQPVERTDQRADPAKQSRTDQRVEARAQGRTEEPGRPSVRVPDRPTDGAPTRYTDLGSGQLVRTSSHVVVRGDSLWSIAAAELGARATAEAIAARWPQWYAANRAVIGPDPDLLLPGQVLHAPSSLDRPVPPTHQEK